MPSASMKMLIELTNNDLDQEEQCLGKLNSEQAKASEQLTMLKQYREDYTSRLLETSKNGVSVASYHNFYRFIGTLDQAITQQSALIEQFTPKIEAQKKQWLEAKQRLNAYQTLQDRRDAEQAQRLARQEQRDNDELSAAMHYRLHHTN